MIFGVLNPEKIWHQELVHLPISPVYYSHFILGNKKHFSTVTFVHTVYFRLLTLSQKKTNVTPLPPHLKNVAALPCKMHNFFIWLKICCIPLNVGGSEKSRLCVGIGGSEKNHLWCVANGMSGKQRYSKCSKWPPSAPVSYTHLTLPTNREV